MTIHQGGAEDDDVTRLSARHADHPDDDATRLASRFSEETSDEAGDDATRLSVRRGDGASPEPSDDDSTQLAVRRTHANPASPGHPRPSDPVDHSSTRDDTTRAAARVARQRRPSVLPPGVPLGDVPSSGSFGRDRDSYGPRPTPPPSGTSSSAPASAPSSDTSSQVLSRTEVEARRARQRRRRLVVGATGAAVGAAGLTAIIVLGVNLLGGGG